MIRQLLDRLFRRRYPLVRLHLRPPTVEGLQEIGEPSMEGVLVGRWDGHYVLEHARLLKPEEDSSVSTHGLSGRQHVHTDRVYWVQEIDRVELGEAFS